MRQGRTDNCKGVAHTGQTAERMDGRKPDNRWWLRANFCGLIFGLGHEARLPSFWQSNPKTWGRKHLLTAAAAAAFAAGVFFIFLLKPNLA